MEKGTIVRLETYGLGFVKQAGTQKQYPFTFDKIEGYHGQAVKELDLAIGSSVDFELSDDRIAEVHIDED